MLKCAFIGGMGEAMLEWVEESLESRDKKDAELSNEREEEKREERIA